MKPLEQERPVKGLEEVRRLYETEFDAKEQLLFGVGRRVDGFPNLKVRLQRAYILRPV